MSLLLFSKSIDIILPFYIHGFMQSVQNKLVQFRFRLNIKHKHKFML